jgi:hypothetical protein
MLRARMGGSYAAYDPWLVVATARKHGPGDTGELIGEGDRSQIAMRKTR